MIRFATLVSLIILLFGCAPPTNLQRPRAAQGAIDIRDWEFRKDGPLELSGHWEFFGKDSLSSFEPERDPDCYIHVPGAWHKQDCDGRRPDKFGAAVYRLKIENSRDNLALRVVSINAAYELFVNDRMMAGRGRPGLAAKDTRSYKKPLLLSLPPVDGTASQTIELRVANFEHNNSGVSTPILLGTTEQLSEIGAFQASLDTLVFALLAFMGVYHLIIFAFRRAEKAILWFGIFAVLVGLRAVLVKERVILNWFPEMPWEFLVRLEYLDLFLSVPIFLLYLEQTYPACVHRFFKYSILTVSSLFSLSALLGPIGFNTSIIKYFQIFLVFSMLGFVWILIQALRRRERQSSVFLIGTLAFAMAVIFDILVARDVLASPVFLTSAVFTGFMLLQASLIALRTAEAFNLSEETSHQLEEKVQTRTSELRDSMSTIAEQSEKIESARQELQKLNQFSRAINSSANIDLVLDQIFEYMYDNFSIEGVMLQLVDRKSQELYYYKTNFRDIHTPAIREYVTNLRIPLTDAGGTANKIFRRGRYTYLQTISRDRLNREDPLENMILVANLYSALIMPLVIQDEVIGLLYFSNYTNRLKLTKPEIDSVSRVCEQIAGAVHGTDLLRQVREEREKQEKLLLNILPNSIAQELKESGQVRPQILDPATVVFTDFVGFTSSSAEMTPEELITRLDGNFSQFDAIVDHFKLEKLKTIGDAYMCAGGLPHPDPLHAINACLAALEFQALMRQIGEIHDTIGEGFWQLRVGIHSGPVTAGVIGSKKFAYDIWGDTVNTASRMESNGEPGKINISKATYELVKDFFQCSYRGELEVKGKGAMEMYFITGIRPELSIKNEGMIPNENFEKQKWELATAR